MNKGALILGAAAAVGIAFFFWPSANGPKAPSGPTEPELKIDPATAGSLSGTVLYTGKAPEPAFLDMSSKPECHGLHAEKTPDDRLLAKNGKLRNAVVYVKSGLPKGSFPLPAGSVVLDQKACMFVPKVVALRAGQTLRLLNSDPTKHNVQTNPEPRKASAFNIPLATKGSDRDVVVDAAEVGIHLVCDYHGWMSGWLCAFDHPFFAVTGEDGAFAFTGLPPGEYEVEAWHESLGTRTGRAKVEPKGSATLDLSFP